MKNIRLVLTVGLFLLTIYIGRITYKSNLFDENFDKVINIDEGNDSFENKNASKEVYIKDAMDSRQREILLNNYLKSYCVECSKERKLDCIKNYQVIDSLEYNEVSSRYDYIVKLKMEKSSLILSLDQSNQYSINSISGFVDNSDCIKNFEIDNPNASDQYLGDKVFEQGSDSSIPDILNFK